MMGVDSCLIGAKSLQTEIDNWDRFIEDVKVELGAAFDSSAILI